MIRTHEKRGRKAIALVVAASAVFTALAACLGATLAAGTPMRYQFGNPNPGYYQLEINGEAVGEEIVTRVGAVMWTSSDAAVASIEKLSGSQAKLSGHSAGVTFVASTSGSGNFGIQRLYQVGDNGGIAAVLLANGGAGIIPKAGGSIAIPVTTEPAGLEKGIEWRPMKGSSDSITVAQATPTTNAAVTAKPDAQNGVTGVIGTLNDKWGESQSIFYIVSIGTPIDDSELSRLLDLIRQAQDIFDRGSAETLYTQSSLNELYDALQAGLAALDDPEPGCGAAATRLQYALEDLEPVGLSNLPPTMHRKLLVIDFDPTLPSKGMSAAQYMAGFWGPDTGGTRYTTQQAITKLAGNMRDASHGILDFDEITYQTIAEFPRCRKNGTQTFQFDEPTFISYVAEADASPHHPIGYFDVKYTGWGFTFDYEYYIDTLDLIARRNAGEFDEIWMMSEFANGYETVMVGRGAYWINGRAIQENCQAFRWNSIAKHRLDTPLENLGHSAESILTQVYGSGTFTDTKPMSQRNTWEKFMQVDKNFPGEAAVGNVHFPPNAVSDYDWINTAYVYSTWRDWRDNYPNLTGEKTYCNKQDWQGGPYSEYNIGHKMWWFSCFPHVVGRDKDGYSHSWWEYYQNFAYTTGLASRLNGSTSSLISLNAGQSCTFEIRATLNDGSQIDVTRDCTITLSNSNMKVDVKRGTVTALGPGSCTLTAKRDGRTCTVTLDCYF